MTRREFLKEATAVTLAGGSISTRAVGAVDASLAASGSGSGASGGRPEAPVGGDSPVRDPNLERTSFQTGGPYNPEDRHQGRRRHGLRH
jgi:hypothetical protein